MIVVPESTPAVDAVKSDEAIGKSRTRKVYQICSQTRAVNYNFYTHGPWATGTSMLPLVSRRCALLSHALAFAALATPAAAAFAFTLAPAELCPSQAVYNESMSAWGGSVIESTSPTDPWRYHMFNGVYTGGCGVNYWRGNSAVAHLVSTTPQGPYQFLDYALPLWHTNPHVVRDPSSNMLLLFAIGQTVNRSEWIECNCSAKVPCPPGPPNPSLAGLIDVHYASSPYGPWTPLIINGSTIAMHGTNPAPWFYPNGTLVLGVNAEGTHVAIVDSWRVGPFQLDKRGTLPPVTNVWYEDPFIFTAGGKWRQLGEGEGPLMCARGD